MLLGLLTLVAAGCTDSGTGDVDGTPSAGPSVGAAAPGGLPCAEPIENGAEVPDSYAVIADAVALPTAESAERALQTSHDEGAPAPNYFAKTGLLLRPGVALTLEVGEPPETAQLGWGSPAEFGSAITTDGCAGDEWIVFAGGFLVDEPHCVEITVRTEATEETVEVGVGAACEGQQPPPEPSDP